MECFQKKVEYEQNVNSLSMKKKLEKIISEYRITQNNFNPNKSSPPNYFMNKLEQRMKHYYHNNTNKNF